MSRRGKYIESQEYDEYDRRRSASLKMDRSISPAGILLFGKHRGKKISDVPGDYIAWAKDNIAGFADRLARHNQTNDK